MAFGIITGSVLGGIADLLTGERANRANERNVERQMEFQDVMSRTQYQRAVQDMRAAGLNPMLAYSQGGNVSPSGAAAVNQPTQIGTAISNAVQGRLAGAQVKAVEAQTAKTQLEAAATAAEIPGIAAEARTRETNAVLAERSLQDRLHLLGFDVTSRGLDTLFKQWKYGSTEDDPFDYRRLTELALGEYEAEKAENDFRKSSRPEWVKRLPFETRREAAMALIQEYGVPGARRDAEAWESGYGAIRPYIRDGALGGSAAASAAMLDRAARLAAGRRREAPREAQKPGEARLRQRRPEAEMEMPFPY